MYDDIFSQIDNPVRGWKRIQDIYKAHRDTPAYKSYANRFREAIEELKKTFVDQAKDINNQVGSITPKRIINMDDSGNFFDLDQTNADIQSLTSELTTALEQVGLLQNQVISLQDNVVVLENEVSSLSADKSTLINENSNLQASLTTVTEERDYYQDKWEDWYAIALEQVRIMVEVLGISQ